MANGRNGNGNGRNGNGASITPITREDLDSVEALRRSFGLFAEEMRLGMDVMRSSMKTLTEFVKDTVNDMVKRQELTDRRQDASDRRIALIEKKLAAGGRK